MATVIAGALLGDTERTQGSALDTRKDLLRSMFTDLECFLDWSALSALGFQRPKSDDAVRSRSRGRLGHAGGVLSYQEHWRESPKTKSSPNASGRTAASRARARPFHFAG